MPIPAFVTDGLLPPGVHAATWVEIRERYGVSGHRRKLLKGLERALASLKLAGCKVLYLDGSFVTAKPYPKDFDACWEEKDVDPTKLDPVLLTFDKERITQKLKFGGELFPAAALANGFSVYLKFFQIDRATGQAKGIVSIDLAEWKP